jgi:hypothetical protein
MSATYTPLAFRTLTSDVASVTFGSIPATYRDLIVIVSCHSTTSGSQDFRVRFNGDSGSNYWNQVGIGNGSSVSAYFVQETSILPGRQSTNARGNFRKIDILDYAQSKHKACIAVSGASGFQTEMLAARWANTAAITSIGFSYPVGNIANGSTFELYGVIS